MEIGQKEYTEPKAGDERTITLRGGAQMVFVWCPPGEFMMGEKGRQHTVTLARGFWMAKPEVTQKQWQSVMGNNPSRFRGDDLPVECVSWDDCQEFGRKTGLRLPTEAEWEYACRAGSTTEYFWGDALNGDKANCVGDYPYGTEQKGPYREKTAPVGSYPANRWGLQDMHGNVWEWCEDWYGPYPSGAVTDPQGAASGSHRVLRGGSWNDGASICLSAHRSYGGPGFRIGNLGFRPCPSAGLH